jgi:hypothetical protein
MLISDQTRPCLACAREACAQAGYPGIDLHQPGHVCGKADATGAGPEYLLDGERVEVDDLIRANTDPEACGAEGLSPEQVQEIRHMMPGDTLHLGGGAGETFTLTRTR